MKMIICNSLKKLFTKKPLNDIEQFWLLPKKKKSHTQEERYTDSPEYIKKFIRLGGGSKMGTTLEHFAKHRFKNLKKRNNEVFQSGYDHIIKFKNKEFRVEQKSSGYWDHHKKNDFKWQHIEENHNWDLLLLCGIDYTDLNFWVMDRKTFITLICENKITNQGNKGGNSSQGKWCWYSDIKDHLNPIHDDDQLLHFLEVLCE